MRITLVNPQQHILDEISDKRLKRNTVAVMIASLRKRIQEEQP